MKKIMVVEDDHGMADLVRSTLVAESFVVEVARTGTAALSLFRSFQPDLVILDRMLPEMDGLEVLRELHKISPTPVLFLTVRDDVMDKVLGLELGADDYMTKPFSTRELVARVRTALRRNRIETITKKLTFGSVVISLNERTVTRDGAAVEMTRTEFDLLALMAQSPGIVFSREQLLAGAWGYTFEGYERTVDSHVTRVRKKIETDPRHPDLILTVWGVGYRFRPREGP